MLILVDLIGHGPHSVPALKINEYCCCGGHSVVKDIHANIENNYLNVNALDLRSYLFAIICMCK